MTRQPQLAPVVLRISSSRVFAFADLTLPAACHRPLQGRASDCPRSMGSHSVLRGPQTATSSTISQEFSGFRFGVACHNESLPDEVHERHQPHHGFENCS
jgi:hypothetical protein